GWRQPATCARSVFQIELTVHPAHGHGRAPEFFAISRAARVRYLPNIAQIPLCSCCFPGRTLSGGPGSRLGTWSLRDKDLAFLGAWHERIFLLGTHARDNSN